jgi:hypothetical protein
MFSGDELMVASQFSKNEYRQRELLKAKSQEQLRAPLKKHPSVSHAVTLKEQYTWELEMKTQIQHIMQDEFSEKKILQSYIRKRSRDDAKIDYQRSSTTQAWRRRLKQEDHNILERGGGETFGRVGGRRSGEKHGSHAPPPSSSARPPRKARLHRPFLLSFGPSSTASFPRQLGSLLLSTCSKEHQQLQFFKGVSVCLHLVRHGKLPKWGTRRREHWQ